MKDIRKHEDVLIVILASIILIFIIFSIQRYSLKDDRIKEKEEEVTDVILPERDPAYEIPKIVDVISSMTSEYSALSPDDYMAYFDNEDKKEYTKDDYVITSLTDAYMASNGYDYINIKIEDNILNVYLANNELSNILNEILSDKEYIINNKSKIYDDSNYGYITYTLINEAVYINGTYADYGYDMVNVYLVDSTNHNNIYAAANSRGLLTKDCINEAIREGN